MTADEFTAICEQFFDRLGEHADSIQVLATFHDSTGTTCRKRGTGNWYSRQHAAREFTQEDQAKTAAIEMREVMKPAEED